MNNSLYDVAFVGAGVMGCAIATNLLQRDPQLKIALIEKDLSYEYSSTVLSDGNSRVQFNIKENIQMSLYALEVLANFAEDMAVDGEKPEVGFRRQGNLFLTDESGLAEVEAGLALQQSLGGNVSWLTPDEAKEVFPLLNIEDGLFVGATFGRDDGTMLPQAVLEAYKKKAVSLGAHLIEAEVTAVRHQAKRVTGVQLANGDILQASVVVNSAGGWGTQIAQTCGVKLPMEPVMRQVYIMETAVRPDNILPLLLLPSGTYLIHEGHGLFMCGRSFADDPVTTTDFSWQRSRFEERLWPELVDFLPTFDSLRVTDGWAGIYAVNTFDGNAILGEWPDLQGFYLVNGFSGHGFQQCHAVGRYLAECILGLPHSLDLSIFSPRRILENAPVFENQQKLI
ncbi:NAD(P)/FAD-dependent oxidoreductase [Candidatus Leptofilum sp.]|uniref:NAD(P)/FAD-dependent oxidoreductase n=1 Tax=Candidatus Leptofilum sp. TaxID=3241576 RepID=UPI003B5A9E27